MTASIQVSFSGLVGPVIELPTSLGEIDLHNFANFHQLTYMTEGRLLLEWRSSNAGEFKIGHRIIDSATLVFDQVSQLSLTPRDPDIPGGEDRALEDFIVQEANDEGCQVRFTFAGGAKLEVTASSAELLIE